tara:strand:- start:445 stop:588 length:144 start_codon:yes stop_codon:yes gene_type:complete
MAEKPSLHWRIKKNGKWTWIPANVVEVKHIEGHPGYTYVRNLEEEEE